MPRGGKREKAGRKSTWVSGRKIEDTTIIRVPKEYAAQLLEIAHKLDAGEVLEFATESKKNLEEENERLRKQLIELGEEVGSLKFRLAATSMTQLQIEVKDQKMLNAIATLGYQLDLFSGQDSDASSEQEQLPAEPEVLPNSVGPLEADELARRLRIGSQALAKARKNKSLNFSEWSRRKDPEGIAWKYSKGGIFQPIL